MKLTAFDWFALGLILALLFSIAYLSRLVSQEVPFDPR